MGRVKPPQTALAPQHLIFAVIGTYKAFVVQRESALVTVTRWADVGEPMPSRSMIIPVVASLASASVSRRPPANRSCGARPDEAEALSEEAAGDCCALPIRARARFPSAP